MMQLRYHVDRRLIQQLECQGRLMKQIQKDYELRQKGLRDHRNFQAISFILSGSTPPRVRPGRWT